MIFPRGRIVPGLILTVVLAAFPCIAGTLPPPKLPAEFPPDTERVVGKGDERPGRALADGICLLASGDTARATLILERFEGKELEDYRVYFLARARMMESDRSGALQLLEGFPRRFPGSPWGEWSLFWSAVSLWENGDRKEALLRIRELSRARDPQIAAWSCALAALYFRSSGDEGWKGEVERLSVIGLDHPAARALAAEWREPLHPLLPDAPLAKAVAVLNEHRALDLLFPALDLLAQRSSGKPGVEVLEIDGTASYLTRRNERSAAAFQAILDRFPATPAASKALYHQAMLAYRKDDTATAHSIIRRLIKEHPGSLWAQRGARSLARDLFGHGDRAEARKVLADALAQAGSQAIFDLVWSDMWLAYKDGDAAALGEKVDKALDQWKEAYRRGRMAYWRARSAAGKESFKDAAGSYPLTLWGMLAAWRDGGAQEEFLGPGVKIIAATIPAVVQQAVPTTGRGRLLADMGLFCFAAREERGENGTPAWLLYRGGDYAGAIALGAGKAAGGNGSAARNWRITYPRPYRDLVAALCKEHGVEPALVYAIMREESRFDPLVVSAADARGLMQLYPPTTLTDFPCFAKTADDLMDVPTNVAIGVTILGRLLKGFDGAIIPTIAAYNAGKAAADRWVSRGKGLPVDEFIEEISYDQTRDYVVRVLTSLAVYRALDRVDGPI